MQVTVQKWGNSNGIRIPKNMLIDLGLQDGSKVDLVKQGNEIIIKKIKPHISLSDRYKQHEKEHGKITTHPNEIDFGESTGSEVW